MKPKIYQDLITAIKDHPSSEVIEIYKNQLEELKEIRFNQKLEKVSECWVFFPWTEKIIHMVGEEDLNELRTNRNQNLITNDEQKILLAAKIGVVGLSVGAEIILNLVYSGIGNTFALAEFDKLETANLNRIKASVAQIGLPKIELISRRIYEINPYANLQLFDSGLNDENLSQFLDGLNLIIEECDDFKLKIKLRQEAKKRGIPVITATSLGDNLLLDIERYDLDPNLPLFHGLLGDVPEQIIASSLSPKDTVKYAIQIVGIEHIPTAALESLLQIGKTLIGRPQLNSTVTVASGLTSVAARRMLLKKSLPSNRHFISFNALLGVEDEDQNRQDIINKIKGLLEI